MLYETNENNPHTQNRILKALTDFGRFVLGLSLTRINAQPKNYRCKIMRMVTGKKGALIFLYWSAHVILDK